MCLSLYSTSNTMTVSWVCLVYFDIILSKTNMEEGKWNGEEKAANKECILKSIITSGHLEPCHAVELKESV